MILAAVVQRRRDISSRIASNIVFIVVVAAIKILVLTGCRKSEILTLR